MSGLPKKKRTISNNISAAPITPDPTTYFKPSPMIEDYKKLQLAKQLNNDQIDMLVRIESYLGEYLDDFIIVGHAINGARVSITHANTPKDMDSLEQFYTDNLILLKNKKIKESN